MDKLREMIKQAYDTNALPEEARERGLSALLSAEGQDRRDGITMTKGRRFNKKLIVISAAAAVAAAMAITAGASTYKYLHKESVEQFGVSEVQYAGDGFEAFTVSNEHFDLTVETMMSDGINAHIVFTLTPLDEAGRNYVLGDDPDFPGLVLPEIRMWKDGEEHDVNDYHGLRSMSGTGGGGLLSDGSISFMGDVYVGDLQGKDVFVQITDYENKHPELFEGINFKLNFAPNMATRVFTDSEGRSITVTQVGYTVNSTETEQAILDAVTDEDSWNNSKVVYKDGTTEELFKPSSTLLLGGGGPGQGFFAQTIDLENAEVICIGGIEFR